MPQLNTNFVVCIRSELGNFKLQIGQVYRLRRSQRGDHPTELRVIDQSGEDYLYPADWFVPISLPPVAQRILSERVLKVAPNSKSVPSKPKVKRAKARPLA